MPLIQSKNVIHFECNEKGKHFAEEYTTKGGGAIEEIPDWVRGHHYYPMVVGAGHILELNKLNGDVLSPVPPPSQIGTNDDGTPVDHEDGTPNDDGTTNVRSLAMKMSETISATRAILKEHYGIDAPNGSYELSPEQFQQVLCDNEAYNRDS